MHPAVNAPGLAELNHLLQDLQLTSSASEIHGMMTGLLTGGVRLNRQQLVKVLEAHTEADQAFDERLVAGLWQLQLATLEALGATDLVFEPLIPEDDVAMGERLEGLADWCQGLLAGFGLAVRGDDARLQEGDLQETLQDLVHIAQVGGGEDSEEDEQSYMEIYEFVRLAAIHLFEEMAPREEHREEHPQLH